MKTTSVQLGVKSQNMKNKPQNICSAHKIGYPKNML